MRTKRFLAPVALAVALSVVPAMAEAIEASRNSKIRLIPVVLGHPDVVFGATAAHGPRA